jgi:hypothetical protein
MQWTCNSLARRHCHTVGKKNYHDRISSNVSHVMSFARSFVRAFVRSLVRSFTRSLVRSLVRSIVFWLVRSFARSLARSSAGKNVINPLCESIWLFKRGPENSSCVSGIHMS